MEMVTAEVQGFRSQSDVTIKKELIVVTKLSRIRMVSNLLSLIWPLYVISDHSSTVVR